MASPRWGKKHTCLECGAAFYDMQRSPMACPKCGAKHEPVVLLKSDGRPPRKSRGHRPAPPAPVPAAVEPAASDESETETTEEDGEVLEVDDEAEADEEGAAEPDDQDR